MTSKVVKTATVAAVALTVAVVLMAYLTVVPLVSAQSPAPSTFTPQTYMQNRNMGTPFTSRPGFQWGQQVPPMQGAPMMRGWLGFGQFHGQASLSVGQTITITSTQGRFFVAGNHRVNGTASGTLTFTVTSKLMGGYTLSLTAGSLVVNGTTYTISSGSAQMDLAATVISGQGTTTTANQFIVRAMAHGSFASTSGTVSIDLKAGTTEYLVMLTGGIQG